MENSTKSGPVLFVCTGNYYRSRFAEIYFNHLANIRSIGLRAFSRGFIGADLEHGPISRFALERLKELDIEITEVPRYPLILLREDLDRAGRVIALDRTEHTPLVERLFPDRRSVFEFWEIADIDITSPRQALPRLEALIEQLLNGETERESALSIDR